MIAFRVGGGKGDGVGAHESLGRRIGIMTVAAHADRTVIRIAHRAGGQTRRIAGGHRAAETGGQRTVGIARTGGQGIGHHHLGRGRGNHAMGIGGGKGYRIGAHETAVGHIGISPARPHGHMTVGGAAVNGAGQARTVGHGNHTADRVLRLTGPARGGTGQSVADHHLSRHDVLLTARPIGGGQGDGIGAHKPLGRRIAVMVAIRIHTHGAMTRRTAGAGGQSGRIGHGNGARKARCQRSRHTARRRT